MSRKKKPNDHGTGIPSHEVEALARLLLPEIQKFFESEEGQQEYRSWKQQQEESLLAEGDSEDDSKDDFIYLFDDDSEDDPDLPDSFWDNMLWSSPYWNCDPDGDF